MRAKEEPLERYRSMRDFGETPEPAGGESQRTTDEEGRLRFVVQEHHARRLHWDFRLERDGVLISWALPKGVPPDPKVNHLAVPTEDHPMSYIDFDGEIPAGNYGAGKVMIWDRGTYETHKWEPREVMVTLHGERVYGRHVLFRTGERQWMIHRMDPPQDPEWRPLPEGLRPIRAVEGALPDEAEVREWSFEITWPGLRVLVGVAGGSVEVTGEDGADVSALFPELRALGRALGSRAALLDGVVIVAGDDGRPDADALDRRLDGAKKPPAVLMVGDLLHLDGRDLVDRAHRDRRELLDGLEMAGAAWQTPPAHPGEGEALLEAARRQGLPGVTAKHRDSAYEPGGRSPSWRAVGA